MLKASVAVTVLLLAPVTEEPPALAAGPRAKAEKLFERYDALEKAFDPAVAELYSDEAVIKNKRTYPGGQVRELILPAPRYQELLRQAMPLAKLRGDTSKYSDCRYSAEGSRVRIACTRFSVVKGYSSPISLLVGPGPKGEGEWLIFEELSESRP